MQISSSKGSMVLDFYPIKDWNNNIIPDKFLRILTFRGQTQNKRNPKECWNSTNKVDWGARQPNRPITSRTFIN